MKSGELHSADAHRRIAEITRTPEMRQRISERTKEGMGSLPSLDALLHGMRRVCVRAAFMEKLLPRCLEKP